MGGPADGGPVSAGPARRRITRSAKSAAASSAAMTSCQAPVQQTASVSGSPTSIAAAARVRSVRSSNLTRV